MSRLGFVMLALLALAACKREPAKAAIAEPTGSGSAGSATPVAVEAPLEPAVAALPGELWFVEDGPPHRLVVIARGERRAIARSIDAALFPSRARLPDGRVVAIASKGDGTPDSEQLVLVGRDGAHARIGPAAAQVRDPVAAASGAWIVAAIQRDGRTNLERVDLATGEVTKLTDDPQGNFRPASLGGDAIVFVSSRDGDAELYRGTASGGAVQRLTAFHKDDFDPAPSPDGKTLAFLSDRETIAPRIFLVAADGTNLRRLTARVAAGEEEEADVAWSPDAARVAYVVRRPGASRVIVRELATGAEHAITPDGAVDAEPAWSPDGAWLVVSRASVGARGEADLWAVPVAGGDAVRVTATPGMERLARWF